VDDGDDRGLSIGEMSAEVVGVLSVVASRRRAVSDGSAVVVMAMTMGGSDGMLEYAACLG
jgi:hypothetical protein